MKLSSIYERGGGQVFWQEGCLHSRRGVCVADGIFPWVIPSRAKYIQFRVTTKETEQSFQYNQWHGLVGSPEDSASVRWTLENWDFGEGICWRLPKGEFVQCLWWGNVGVPQKLTKITSGISTVLLVLKRRRRVFKKELARERKAASLLAHKSRNIRKNSPHNARRGWYTDRMQELNLIIAYLEGRITTKEFVPYMVEDNLGMLCRAVGGYLWMTGGACGRQ